VSDARIDRLADLIVGYSLELGEGDVVRIDALEVAAPLALALYRSALAAGAHPYTNITLDGLTELLVREGSDAQLDYIAPTQWREVDALDALVTIWADGNTRSMSRADPERHRRQIQTERKLANRRWERIAAGELRWCGTHFPTQAHAQEAEMPLAEYEAFVLAACYVDREDPAAHWRAQAESLEARAAELSTVRELRVLGPDTDLRLAVEGRRWLAAAGRHPANMPDGEVFTSPLETETQGEIRFSFPAVFRGREVDDVRLRFEAGRVVAAEAAEGEEYLSALLDMDDGARVAGEFAFGLNYEIDRFTRNILLDEKIGGTVHLALGAGFKQVGGRNASALHWDMICDLRRDGEVYADGDLVWKAGRFVGEPVGEKVDRA
jgi:aminopeptidase